MARWWATVDKNGVKQIFRGRKPREWKPGSFASSLVSARILQSDLACDGRILQEIFPQRIRRGECVELWPPYLKAKPKRPKKPKKEK